MNTGDLASAAELELFDDTLSCDVVVPAQFIADATVQRSGSSEMLLRSIALVEDSRSNEDADERNDSSAQLQRLEARMDLTLVLLGRLLQQSAPTLPALPVRWSRLGLRLDGVQSDSAVTGGSGVIRLQPAEWLPDFIELPVMVLAQAPSTAGSSLWLRLQPVSDALMSALERHLFRLHRKQVADSRRNR